MKGKAYIHSLLHLISNANLRNKQCTFLKPPDTLTVLFVLLYINFFFAYSLNHQSLCRFRLFYQQLSNQTCPIPSELEAPTKQLSWGNLLSPRVVHHSNCVFICFTYTNILKEVSQNSKVHRMICFFPIHKIHFAHSFRKKKLSKRSITKLLHNTDFQIVLESDRCNLNFN